MPIYEYQCPACGGRAEVFHRTGSRTRPRCDECGRAMNRVISPTAFVLKGSGWYVTDYPSKSRKEGMASEKASGKKKPKKKKSPAKKESPSTGGTEKKSLPSR